MGIRKLDSSNYSTENMSETIPPFGVKSPSVSLYSTDDPVDKLYLVLVPLVSSAGVAFPKTSELPRSLTFGDNVLNGLANWNSLSQKLQCIPGFRTALIPNDIYSQLHEVGAVFFSLTEGMHSNSKKSSVSQNSPSFPVSLGSLFNYFLSGLRVSSVNSAVFNIKVGEGSLIKKSRDGRNLAQSLRSAFKRMQINTSSFLTDLSQPIGRALGNSLEIREAIEILKGSGPLDLLKLALELGSDMLLFADKTMSKGEAKEILKKKIVSGDGLKKFREIIQAQEGDTRIIDNDSLLPFSEKRYEIRSFKTGFIQKIKTRKLYSVYLKCVAQERKQTGSGKCGIGFVLQKQSGDWVKKGESLVEVHLNSKVSRSWTEDEFQEIFLISESPPPFQPLIIERIED
jgi:pyrimidine-nucleoside phosphorylase